MPGLAWLTARPIAHRGLHDAAAGVIENTASAFAAAIAGGYGIETDLQISADGEAMVHHDDALGRLTEGSGRLADMTAAEIKAVRFKADARPHPDAWRSVRSRRRPRHPGCSSSRAISTATGGWCSASPTCWRTMPARWRSMSFDPAMIEAGAPDRAAADARHRRRAPLRASRMGSLSARGKAPHGVPAARRPQPPAVHRLRGEGPAGAGAADGARHLPACRC